MGMIMVMVMGLGLVGTTTGIERESIGERLHIQSIVENLFSMERMGIGLGQNYQTDKDGNL
jgi:hypothetical protein